MSKKILLLIGSLLISRIYADYTCTSCLIDAPKAYLLPHRTFRGVLSGSFALKRGTKDPGIVGDIGIGYGLLDRFEFSFTMYTLTAYGLGVTWQVMPERDRYPAIAVGVQDVNWQRHVCSVGGGWDSEGNPKSWAMEVEYYHKKIGLLPTENFSFFSVLSKKVHRFFLVHFGLGRGRFVGYGPHSGLFNTDLFSKRKHDWAIGAFGGMEFPVSYWLKIQTEYDGRDFNFGIEGYYDIYHFYLSLVKIESIFWGGKTCAPRLAMGFAVQPKLKSRPLAAARRKRELTPLEVKEFREER